MYKKMPEYYEAYDEVRKSSDFYIEMTREEAGVLCGIIEKHRPKKIVEIGVAGGGSTCLMLKCMELLGMNETTMCSIDLSERFYRDKTKETGYLLTENKEKYKYACNHGFLLGKSTIDRMEDIEEDIDLLFLDTEHVLPGEILDFLLLFPRLSKNAVVVLHDTCMYSKLDANIEGKDSISNRVLVNTVTAKKYYTSKKEYLNIGAFQINEDTHKYIGDVFAALLLPWKYYKQNEAEKYTKVYEKSYPSEIIEIWKNAMEINHKIIYFKIDKLICDAFATNKQVYIYGYGNYGIKLLNYVCSKGYQVNGIIVSDKITISDLENPNGEKIYHYSEIPSEMSDTCIILGTVNKEVKKLLKNSLYEVVDIDFCYFWSL